MKFFNHIPFDTVHTVIAGVSKEAENELKKLKITVIPPYKSTILPPSVCSHPDMTILPIGNGEFICSPDSYEYYKSRINGAAVTDGKLKISEKYPDDATYNITVLGENVFLNPKSQQVDIYKKFLYSKRQINIRQGYTKCSICIVNENAIITSDSGIYEAALKLNIDVLKIRAGYIKLKGMDYGFIGGAAGLTAPDILSVNGDISTHPDAERIGAFCKNHGVNILNLKSGIIEDIGSIIPIY